MSDWITILSVTCNLRRWDWLLTGVFLWEDLSQLCWWLVLSLWPSFEEDVTTLGSLTLRLRDVMHVSVVWTISIPKKASHSLTYSFLTRGGKKLVIGEDNKPVMEVVVYNTGEPAFLPNMTVTVAPPLVLDLPISHNCEFSNGVNRSSIVCQLVNPIPKDGKVSSHCIFIK